MSLLPELQAAVDKAQAGDLRGLHQALLGPGPSGKTTQAHEYAAALAVKGVGGQVHDLEISQLKFVGDIGRQFTAAKGGTLVIDELQNTSETQRREVMAHIVRAISDNDTLVIMTGALSLENDIDMDPGLKRRMNPPIIFDRIFTRAEMDGYREAQRVQRMAREQEQQEQALRAQRVAEWKAAKNEDLRPAKPITAPKTARFRKPEVAL